uniref:SDR family NAD(P)-dependent oxidoreductase n=1 Tax=Desulfacinum infernum TaxID=35837 RepID=A0A831ZTU2_9BACT
MKREDKGAVFITGAGSGIGKAAAVHLCEAGYQVFAGMRRESDATALRALCPWKLTPVVLDITRPEQIREAVDLVQGVWGLNQGLRGLINNAGIGIGGPLEFLDLEDLRRQYEVNVFGHVAVTQAFLPFLRACAGRIINVGSMAGRVSLPFSGPYASSKAALAALTDALRRELAWWKIPVILLEIGSVKTPIWDKAFASAEERARKMPPLAQSLYEKPLAAMNGYMHTLVRHAVRPEKVARTIVKALETPSPKTRYFVGHDAYLGLMTRLLPDRWVDWLLQKEQERRFPKSR